MVYLRQMWRGNKRGINNIFKRMPTHEYLELRENMAYGYTNALDAEFKEMPPIIAVEIIAGYNRKDRTIHLCDKCRKAFERFMRNEDNG